MKGSGAFAVGATRHQQRHVAVQRRCFIHDVQAVGHHRQRYPLCQPGHHLQGGAATVENDGLAIPDQARGPGADALLGVQIEHGFLVHGVIFQRRLGERLGAAIAADYQLGLLQMPQIAAHRGAGDVEMGGQIVD